MTGRWDSQVVTGAAATIRYPALWLAIGAILLAPLIAMRFTTEVNWTAFDFAAAALLLGGAALAFEVGTRLVTTPWRRRALAAVLVAVVAVIWVDGAVGIF
jgi:hypothetical protein